MLRTLPLKRENSSVFWIASIAVFTILMIISARMRVDVGFLGVPFTMQVFVVLLSGMVLGARDGLLTQVIYVSLIASGQPWDTNSLGTAALFGPTGGYLIGFIFAAFVAGWLVERAGERLWQRWIAGIVGIGVIYFFGVSHLMAYTGADLATAWAGGAAPFVALDLLKALMAAAMVEGGRSLILRNLDVATPH